MIESERLEKESRLLVSPDHRPTLAPTQLVSSLFLHVPATIPYRNFSHHGGSFHPFHPSPQATAAALPCLRVACYTLARESHGKRRWSRRCHSRRTSRPSLSSGLPADGPRCY